MNRSLHVAIAPLLALGPLTMRPLAMGLLTMGLLTTAACGGEDQAKTTASGSTSAAPVAAGPLAVGDVAPPVTLTLHDGKTVDLASLKGKQVLVFFYPKDDTPGCTVEAQGLRDAYADLQAAGVQVFGVSLQGAASHEAFIDKHDLPYPLAVDESGALARAFRVPVKGEYASRQSFLIGADGKIKKVWLDVKPAEHAAEVLSAAKS